MKSVNKPRGLCPATGCRNPGNPFCYEHLRPYAEYVLSELDKQSDEVARAKRGHWRKIDVEGSIATEFLRIVRFSKRPTLARINRELFHDQETAISYMTALRKAGKIKTGKSRKGLTVVWLPDKAKKAVKA